MRRRLLPMILLATVASSSLATTIAHAGDDDAGSTKSAKKKADAEVHYKRARELYSLGRYREAIAQLEAALRADPQGAELLYNLGLVHEKLGEAEEAIDAYKRYLVVLGSDGDAEEIAKIKGIIKRLQGAKDELKAREAKQTEHRFTPLSAGLMIGSGVALVAFGVFGWLALNDDKTAQGYVVHDPSGLADRQAVIDSSKRNALLADIFGGVAVAAAGASLTLYFLSEFTKEDDPRRTSTAARLSVTPLPAGASVRLEVAF